MVSSVSTFLDCAPTVFALSFTKCSPDLSEQRHKNLEARKGLSSWTSRLLFDKPVVVGEANEQVVVGEAGCLTIPKSTLVIAMRHSAPLMTVIA